MKVMKLYSYISQVMQIVQIDNVREKQTNIFFCSVQ